MGIDSYSFEMDQRTRLTQLFALLSRNWDKGPLLVLLHWPATAAGKNWLLDRAAALTQLDGFVAAAGRAYANTLNHDDGSARTNVSLLSPWLHAGVDGVPTLLFIDSC